MINSKVDSSDTAGLVAVGNAGSRVSDVAKCAVVVADDSASKRRARKISLNGGVCRVKGIYLGCYKIVKQARLSVFFRTSEHLLFTTSNHVGQSRLDISREVAVLE